MEERTQQELFEYLVDAARNRLDRRNRGGNPHAAAGYDSRISLILREDVDVNERERVIWVKIARLIYYSAAEPEQLNMPISEVDNPTVYNEID